MSTILHLADLHLGALFDGLPEPVASACRQGQRDALRQAVAHANRLQADAILIAGDFFDQPAPEGPLVREAFSLLAQAACPVLIAPGNHDFMHPESPYLSSLLPQNVNIFETPFLTPYPLSADTVVWGAAFCDRSAKILLEARLSPDVCHLLLVHADLLADSGYNPLRPIDLQKSGFSYAALGHNHEFLGLMRAGDTQYACPGCLTSRGPQEPGARGYLCGTVELCRVSLRFTASEGITFETLQQDLTGICSDRALGQAIAAQLPKGRTHAFLTLTLMGERQYAPDLSALRHALNQVFLYAEVQDQTQLQQNPWRHEESDDLRGAVTRRLQAQYEETGDASQQERLLLALRYALAALDGEELPKGCAL